MPEIDFIGLVHKATKRDYIARVTEFPKAKAARLASQWGRDYWDGDRKTGYGGFSYDGRWRKVAKAMSEHYGIKPGDRILDVGCGKAFLLYDFTQVVPGVEVYGLDISEYGIEHAKPEVRDRLTLGSASSLPYDDDSFDLVVSINTLHNLPCEELESAFKEIERVGKNSKFVCVESFRTEEEKVNLLYWQLTCRAFYSPEDWSWWHKKTGYSGDYGYIYFE